MYKNKQELRVNDMEPAAPEERVVPASRVTPVTRQGNVKSEIK